MAYKVTSDPPNGHDLTLLFKSFLTPDLKKRCDMIHCDRSGSNFSGKFLDYIMNDIKVKLSFTTKKYHNQVVEGTNKYLKQMLETRQFTDQNTKIPFVLLPYELKITMIKNLIEEFNNMTTVKSSNAQGYSRELTDKAHEFFRDCIPELMDNTFFITSSKTNQGRFIRKWNQVIITLFFLFQKQQFLNITYNANLNIISKKDAQELYTCLLTQDIKKLNNIIMQQQQQEQRINSAIETGVNEAPEDSKDKSFYELKTELEELKNQVKQLEKKKEVSNKKIEKTRILEELKTSESPAIMPEDFPLILRSITKLCKNRATQAKYIILHVFLKLTGARISSVIYFNFDEMENFINRRTFYIRLSNIKINTLDSLS
jgi:hypothetical protein